MANQIASALRILRRNQVEERTGLSRASIYAFMKTGAFPKSVALGARSVGWRESDIEDWISSRTEKTRENQNA